MKLAGNTILITGGSEGIGFAMARRLLPHNTVIVCGRSQEKLRRAKVELPGLVTEVCDVTDEHERRELVARVVDRHPELNILINNAGAKTPTNLLTGEGVAAGLAYDTALNFTAPAALCGALLPHMMSRPRAAIVNMTTGLVYLPKAEQAFYSAAKAALHSYSQSLRWALQGAPLSVHEVLLTLVDTNFHQGKLPTNIPAISADEAARVSLEGLQQDKPQIHVGKAALARWMALLAPQRGMAIVNQGHPGVGT